MPGAPAKPAGARTTIRTARSKAGDRALDAVAAGGGARARHRILHGDPPQPATAFAAVPLQRRVPERARRAAAALLREAAALATEPTLKAFLTKRADAFLSNDYYDSDVAWMELKGAIEPTHRPVRGLRRRVVQLQGRRSSRSSRCRTRRRARSCSEFAGELQDIENHLPIDPTLPQPEARRAGADRRRQRDLRGRRREPRRADGGVQPAERRARDPREGRQARHAEERAGREVREDARCRSRRSCSRPPIRRTSSFEAFFTHILVHELMHGLGPHNITVERPADDGAAGVEGNLQRHRGSEGRHLVALRDSAHDRQGRAAEIARAAALHDVPGVGVPIDPLRRQRSARQAASPCS